jgi:c-di-GMP-binding flagellar brake protein YcgR
MKFTESQFTEVVELLQAMEPLRNKRKDKRRANRTEIRISVKITTETGTNRTKWRTAELRDLSARGVRLVTEQAMPGGTSFLILLPTKAAKEGASPLVCRVAHCQAQSNGTFSVGAEFVCRLDSAPQPENAAEQERIQRSILD